MNIPIRHMLFFMMTGLLLLSLVACSSKPTPPQDQPANGATGTVHIAAASSLREPLEQLQTIYETRTGVKLTFQYAGSGALQKQIEQGSAVDLFLAASPQNMNALKEKGFLSTLYTPRWLGNELVIVVPVAQGDSSTISRLIQLEEPKFKRIALADPEFVPAGMYAREALSTAGVWTVLQPKIVLGKDVRQALTYVSTGNVDAGFVYRTDAMSLKDKVRIAATIDQATYSPIVYPMAVLAKAPHRQEAESLYRFLLTPEAIDLFRSYGFSVPPTATGAVYGTPSTGATHGGH